MTFNSKIRILLRRQAFGETVTTILLIPCLLADPAFCSQWAGVSPQIQRRASDTAHKAFLSQTLSLRPSAERVSPEHAKLAANVLLLSGIGPLLKVQKPSGPAGNYSEDHLLAETQEGVWRIKPLKLPDGPAGARFISNYLRTLLARANARIPTRPDVIAVPDASGSVRYFTVDREVEGGRDIARREATAAQLEELGREIGFHQRAARENPPDVQREISPHSFRLDLGRLRSESAWRQALSPLFSREDIQWLDFVVAEVTDFWTPERLANIPMLTIHSDMSFANVLFAPVRDDIIATLDWNSAQTGYWFEDLFAALTRTGRRGEGFHMLHLLRDLKPLLQGFSQTAGWAPNSADMAVLLEGFVAQILILIYLRGQRLHDGKISLEIAGREIKDLFAALQEVHAAAAPKPSSERYGPFTVFQHLLRQADRRINTEVPVTTFRVPAASVSMAISGPPDDVDGNSYSDRVSFNRGDYGIDVDGKRIPWPERVQFQREVKDHLERLKEQGFSGLGIPNSNLFLNLRQPLWLDGTLYYAAGDPVEGLDYPSLVRRRDNRLTIEPVRYTKTPEGAWTILARDSSNPAQPWKVASHDILSAVGSIPLVSGGVAIPPEESWAMWDDLSHLFRFPEFDTALEGKPVMRPFGVQYLYPDMLKPESADFQDYVRRQLRNEPITLPLPGEGTRQRDSLLGSLRGSLGYQEVSGAPTQPGQYRLNGDSIEIIFLRARYSFVLVGRTAGKEGDLLITTIAGSSRDPFNAKGTSVEEATAEMMRAGATEVVTLVQGGDTHLTWNGKTIDSTVSPEAQGLRWSSAYMTFVPIEQVSVLAKEFGKLHLGPILHAHQAPGGGGFYSHGHTVVETPLGTFRIKPLRLPDQEAGALFIEAFLRLLQDAGRPIPTLANVLFVRDSENRGFYSVDRHVEGREISRRNATEAHLEEMGRQMGANHRAARESPLSQERHVYPHSFAIDIDLLRSKAGWLEALRSVLEPTDIAWIAQVTDEVTGYWTPERLASIPMLAIHGDFSFGNVKFDTVFDAICAMFDWDTARTGYWFEDFFPALVHTGRRGEGFHTTHLLRDLKFLMKGFVQTCGWRPTPADYSLILEAFIAHLVIHLYLPGQRLSSGEASADDRRRTRIRDALAALREVHAEVRTIEQAA